MCLAALASCGNRAPKSELQKKVDAYAVFQIGSPYMEGISDNGKEVLNLFRKAADEADNIFWQQTFGDKNAIMLLPDGAARIWPSSITDHGTVWITTLLSLRGTASVQPVRFSILPT